MLFKFLEIKSYSEQMKNAFVRGDSKNTSTRETTRMNISLNIRANSDVVRANVSIDRSEYVPLTVEYIKLILQLREEIHLSFTYQSRAENSLYRNEK